MHALQIWHLLLLALVILIGVALVVAVVLLVVFLVRRTASPTGTGVQPPGSPPITPAPPVQAPDREALTTLQRRLAAGEITTEEFDRLRRHLEEGN